MLSKIFNHHYLFVLGLLICSSGFVVNAEEKPLHSRSIGGQPLGGTVEPARVALPIQVNNGANQWQPGDPITGLEPAVITNNLPFHRPGLRGFGSDPMVELQESIVRQTNRGGSSGVNNGFELLLNNQDGIAFTGNSDPDTSIDIGTEYILQAVNDSPVGTAVLIIDKADPAAEPMGFSTADLVVGSGTNCATDTTGDPIVLYDELAFSGEGRWLITEVNNVAQESVCIYVSQTSDPTDGLWFIYEFAGISRTLPDAFKLTLWPGFYVGGVNDLPNDGFGRLAIALDRENMLLGNPARPVQGFGFDVLGSPSQSFALQLIQGVDFSGDSLPPTGSPAILLRHNDDEFHLSPPASPVSGQDFIEYFEMSVDFDDTSNSSFSGPFTIAVSEFDSELCITGDLVCVPQPLDSEGEVSPPLDPNRDLVMWRPSFRQLVDRQQIVGALTVDINGDDLHGIRWFVLERAANVVSGGWQLQQEGTYGFNDEVHRWIPSINFDEDGNIALAVNVSSSDETNVVFPGIRYAGRRINDTPGTLPFAELNIQPGLGATTMTGGRWGDYSALVVDPVDDCTFWYGGQYAGNAGVWATRLASFAFENCGEPGFEVMINNAPTMACAGTGDVTFNLQTTGLDGFLNPIIFDAIDLPANSQVNSSPELTVPGESAAISIVLPAAATPGPLNFNLRGRAPAAANVIIPAQLQVIDELPNEVTLIAPVNDAFLSVQPIRFDWSDVPIVSEYLLEIATDEAFNSIVLTQLFENSQADIAFDLSIAERLFWRVTAFNACGSSNATSIFSFTSDVVLTDGFESLQ